MVEKRSESLKGKRVLITGASTGIGAEMALQFAAHSARIGLHYRSNREAMEEVARRCSALTDPVQLLQGDLLEPEARDRLIPEFVSAAGGIDVLINNAGAIYDYLEYSELTEDAIDRTFALNAKAPFFLMRDAFRHMKEGGSGRIINISSTSVKYGGGPNNLHYVAAKAALDSLTLGFAREGAKYNILVNSIRCGLIQTEMQRKIPGYLESRMADRIAMVPLKRPGHPADVAAMALHLASDGGEFITGQFICVSGGE